MQAAERRERVAEQEAVTSALNKAIAKMDSSTAARVGEVRATAAAAADGVRRLDAAMQQRDDTAEEEAGASTRPPLSST